jgi:hypothetical protein
MEKVFLENEIEEAKMAVSYYQDRGISAYRDGADVYIEVEDIQILVSGSEVSYRAGLYLEENSKQCILLMGK